MDKNVLQELISEDLSQMQIAKRLGSSQTNVRYWLQKYNLKTLKTDANRNDREYIATCKSCGKEIKGKVIHGRKSFCDTRCHATHRHTVWIGEWLDGNQDGITGKSGTSNHIRKYLRENRGNKCESCGWCEVNKKSGNVPVELDHIDGDFTNNTVGNLRLLCPNCHSLTPTFRALNKNSTRKSKRD